ncbi:hypothetical protein G6F43_008924 [Rhizopus delemar]|nr:hypothetical protein G6F43_008924 [Rhizopus delemar]
MVHILDHETDTLVSLIDYKSLSSPIPTTESLSPPTTEEDDEDDDALNIPKRRKLNSTQQVDDDQLFSLAISKINLNEKNIEKDNKLDTKKEDGPCTECKTIDTPQWRRGPQGYRTLCNACGLRWAKQKNPDEARPLKKTAPKKATPTPKKMSHLLFHRKEFISHGLYSVENRQGTNKPTRFELPLPIHQGESTLLTIKEFELPPFIWQERELNLIKSLKDKRPVFTKIRSNLFVERKPKLCPDERNVCHCKEPTGENEVGCGDDCINRLLFYECDPKHCPCGPKCSNNRFQKKQRKYKLEVFKTDQRGWGLRTLEDIKKGAFVIEYRGEIISQKLCEERMCTDYVNENNFYFLEYSKGEVIDACTKGTEARFINHSCDPNCHIEKWSYRGEAHFGVFASKDIPAYSELSYDYNFSTFNVENEQMCHCGSESCRGTIGKKKK